uniref:Uncharacterized protein n=1 Tax=Zea mays TaxID=4577 RepID=C4J0A4_MAIZE|nr:unknown [Zea mays]
MSAPIILSHAGKLTDVDGRDDVSAAVERQPGDDDVDGRRGVVCVPEHVALPVVARRHEGQAGDLPGVPADAAAPAVDDGEAERGRVGEDGPEHREVVEVREAGAGKAGGSVAVEAVDQRPHVGVEGEHEVVHRARAPPREALRAHARDAAHGPHAGHHEPPAPGAVQPGQLRGQLPREQVRELLRAVPPPRVVVGHQVVVEVVVAAHPHEQDGARHQVRRRRRARRAGDPRHGRLEVLDLLVEWDPPDKVAATVVEDPGGGRGVVDALQDMLHGRGFRVGWHQGQSKQLGELVDDGVAVAEAAGGAAGEVDAVGEVVGLGKRCEVVVVAAVDERVAEHEQRRRPPLSAGGGRSGDGRDHGEEQQPPREAGGGGHRGP